MDDNGVEFEESLNTPSHTANSHQPTPLAEAFQQMIQTRRTGSHRPHRPLLSSAVTASTPSLSSTEYDFYKAALDRAVAAGMAAPNHKRTEPFSFKRILGPSNSTRRLADIAGQVYRHSPKHRQPNGSDSGTVLDLDVLLAEANRKREKWLHIPAFLVTLVSSLPLEQRRREQQLQQQAVMTRDMPTPNDDEAVSFLPLPFVPPANERELEDYAAACAATQNVLLSLHAEHVACKWATGSLIHTPAFRSLVQAQPTDRVVALVQILGREQPLQQSNFGGMSTAFHSNASSCDRSSSASMSRRKSATSTRWHRRQVQGDVLQDL
jgi:nitroreductase